MAMSRRIHTGFTGFCAIVLVVILASCKREQRQFRMVPWAASIGREVRLSALPAPPPYGHNAYAIAEGQRLYAWFNCVGCHAHGGGGIGPPMSFLGLITVDVHMSRLTTVTRVKVDTIRTSS